MGARDYDPIVGRFLSVDPILDPGDPHDPLASDKVSVSANTRTRAEQAAYTAAHPESAHLAPMTAREFLAAITGVGAVVDCLKTPPSAAAPSPAPPSSPHPSAKDSPPPPEPPRARPFQR